MTFIRNYYVSMCVKSREVIKQFPPHIFIHLFAQSMRHHKKVMLMLMSVHTSQSGEREIQGEKFEKQIKKSSKCSQHVLCIFIIHPYSSTSHDLYIIIGWFSIFTLFFVAICRLILIFKLSLFLLKC